MSLTPSNVPWDPNRYKATEYVINYDSNGNPTLSKKEADYTGVNYNFASLPSGSTTTTTDATTTGETTDQTTTQQQTTEAFGDVKPHYWKNEDPYKAEYSKDTGEYKSTLFDTWSTSREQRQTNREIKDIKLQLAGGALDYEEEKALNERLSELQKQPVTGFKATTKKYTEKLLDRYPYLRPFAVKIIDAIAGPVTATEKHAKKYFTAYTSGSMAGRITGHDGTYNPHDFLFHGMNRVSMFGNLEEAGQKRVNKRNSVIDKKGVNDREYAIKYGLKYSEDGVTQRYVSNTRNMEGELITYRKEKSADPDVVKEKQEKIETRNIPASKDFNVSGRDDRGQGDYDRSFDYGADTREAQDRRSSDLGFSDIRLKDNIELIGKSPSNINIYKFNYLNNPTVYQGAMAQEVPWATIKADNGYLMVDYNKVDVEFKKWQ